jgi:uncharacterized protein (TIGR03118 family)
MDYAVRAAAHEVPAAVCNGFEHAGGECNTCKTICKQIPDRNIPVTHHARSTINPCIRLDASLPPADIASCRVPRRPPWFVGPTIQHEEGLMRRINAGIVLFLTALALAAAQSAIAGQLPFYTQHNLVSDDASAVAADAHNGLLVNPWGLVATPTSPWWISNNGSDTAVLYNASTNTFSSLVVSIPEGAPTGVVFNNTGGGFVVISGAASGSATFIFASEAGIISGWNSSVPPPPPSIHAQVGASVPGAVYKGLAIAGSGASARLYATNFHAGAVDVFDNNFKPVVIAGAFTDPRLPSGYAPFGIQNIGGTIYVTYALQDADKHDDVPGAGHGYINAFDTSGTLLRRVVSRGPLNSPWGLALAPNDFGLFSNALLVGNFGDGRINAFDLTGSGQAENLGPLHSASGPPLKIDGLWALQFGNGAGAGPKGTLFFTAGPFDESHGLFGSLVPASSPGHNK